MSKKTTRRGFLLAALAAGGCLALGMLRVTGRAARHTVSMVRIPLKPFFRDRLREPHDLAG